jgi:hypothetical protein
MSDGDVIVRPGATLSAGDIVLQKLTIGGSANVERITNTTNLVFSELVVGGPDAANPASLRAAGIRAGGLSIGHGKVTIKPSGADANFTVVSSLSMTQDGSTLDLTNNDLVLHADGGGPTYYAAMRMLVQRARNSELGLWKGPGITSSAAAENPLTGVALVLNNRIVDGEPQPIFTDISGEPTVLNDVILKYTWNGDTNLDEKVNADDYFRIDSAFLAGASPNGWYDGDFNYDGAINADDYFLIDSAFLGQTATLGDALRAVSIPEPGALLLTLAPVLLLSRRRRD